MNKEAKAPRLPYAALAALLFVVLFTQTHIDGQNVLSRFAAVDALVRTGRLELPQDSAARRIVTRDGHEQYLLVDMLAYEEDGEWQLYSSKPPLYSAMIATVARGLRLVGVRWSLFDGPAVYLLTLFGVGLPTVCGVYAFRRRAERLVPGENAHLVALVTLGGTLLLSYAVTMNHHCLPAVLIMVAFFALGMHEGRPAVSPVQAAVAGFGCGLAAMIDCGPGFFFSVAFGAYLLVFVRSLPALAAYALAGLLPVVAHSIYQIPAFGTVLPAQWVEMSRDYPYSYWTHRLGPDLWHIPRPLYLLFTFFSLRGLFVLSPVLLFGAVGLGRELGLLRTGQDGGAGLRDALRQRRPELGRSLAAGAVCGAILCLVAYVTLIAPTNFGGHCYGMRYYIGFSPLLAFYALRAYERWGERPGVRVLFWALGFISLALALYGSTRPWARMPYAPEPLRVHERIDPGA